MDLTNFFVEIDYNQETEYAEIKPCCQENNVYYYDVFIKNKYQFTVTPGNNEEEGLLWKIALKNADTSVDPNLVGLIGNQIEKHFFDSAL